VINTTLRSDRVIPAASATRLPFIPLGKPTSVTRRSIGAPDCLDCDLPVFFKDVGDEHPHCRLIVYNEDRYCELQIGRKHASLHQKESWERWSRAGGLARPPAHRNGG
jgi:hypothetical protein